MRRHLKNVILGILIIASAYGLHYFRAVSQVVELFRLERARPVKPFQPSAPLLTQPRATMAVKLYFPSLQSPGMLEEEGGEIRASELDQNRAKQILLKLIEGSKNNLGRTISQQTVLRELFLTPDGTAYVDFSGNLQREHPGGTECELDTIYAVVNSLTVNIPSIKRVRFLIDDGEVETLMGHTDLSQTFSQNLNYIIRSPALSSAKPASNH